MDWLPDAIRDPHPRSLPWTETTNPKGCLHTTETSGWPSYDGWAMEPHATVMPAARQGVTVRQHLPFSHGSFALRHTEAQATNSDFVFQFELVGTCAKDGHGYYWPAADDQVLLDLYRKVIKPLSDAFRIPLHSPTWLPYPQSAGGTSVRLSNGQWDVYAGWLGHQHVPQNDHGDPGLFPWARLMYLANPPKPVEAIRGPLRYGATGGSVRIVQEHVGVDVDGSFGRQTLIGVQRFQTRHHLPADGVVGPKTAAAMSCQYVAI